MKIKTAINNTALLECYSLLTQLLHIDTWPKRNKYLNTGKVLFVVSTSTSYIMIKVKYIMQHCQGAIRSQHKFHSVDCGRKANLSDSSPEGTKFNLKATTYLGVVGEPRIEL